MYRIFIVEDDAGIAQGIREQIEQWGMEAHCAADFRNVMAEFAACSPHLVLLDIGLPAFNGYHWCAQIRKVSRVPIIFHLLRFGQYEHCDGHEYGGGMIL